MQTFNQHWYPVKNLQVWKIYIKLIWVNIRIHFLSMIMVPKWQKLWYILTVYIKKNIKRTQVTFFNLCFEPDFKYEVILNTHTTSCTCPCALQLYSCHQTSHSFPLSCHKPELHATAELNGFLCPLVIRKKASSSYPIARNSDRNYCQRHQLNPIALFTAMKSILCATAMQVSAS